MEFATITAVSGRRATRAVVVVFVAAVLAALVLGSACGGEGDLTGTWLRTDDHDFVLTISKGGVGEGYEIHFENTENGESQTITGVVRAERLAAGGARDPSGAGRCAGAGAPEVVPITLKVADGGELVVTMDRRRWRAADRALALRTRRLAGAGGAALRRRGGRSDDEVDIGQSPVIAVANVHHRVDRLAGRVGGLTCDIDRRRRRKLV